MKITAGRKYLLVKEMKEMIAEAMNVLGFSTYPTV